MAGSLANFSDIALEEVPDDHYLRELDTEAYSQPMVLVLGPFSAATSSIRTDQLHRTASSELVAESDF